jgi:hypothetical protein
MDNLIQQAKLSENRRTSWLDHQPGTDRLRRIEPLEQADPMSGMMEQERCCQTTWPASRNRDIQFLHLAPHHRRLDDDIGYSNVSFCGEEVVISYLAELHYIQLSTLNDV